MSRLRWLLALIGVVVAMGAAAALSRNVWLPHAAEWYERISGGEHQEGHGEDEHAGQAAHEQGGEHGQDADHEEAGHVEAAGPADGLELSQQGRQNIGLVLAVLERKDFERTVTVPAIVVERPGRTEITVSAPMTGIVTRIWPIRGEAVSPGAPLFELRLTHEDLVEKQSQLLKALEELDVVRREVARLEHVSANGAIAGKALLERQYEQSKIEAGMRAEKQALVLHGLTKEQVEQIESRRQLVQAITVVAPVLAEEMCRHSHEAFYQVTQLSVKPGDHVVTGTPLATLADHCELHVEGKAFENDAQALNAAAKEKRTVTALVEGDGSGKQEIRGLSLVYVENQVDRESRALRFYVSLPNQLVGNEKRPDGHRFIAWRFRPGQRVELLVPVEHWKDRVVLPVEAVVQEGAESYVYRLEGKRFVRKPVHVEYRDQRWAVIEPGANLAAGDSVAVKGAYQIHLALKNKAGGGVDPHAGHNH